MTTTTPWPGRRIRPHDPARGFTLVEVLIGATLSTFVLTGVLSTFLMLGRSGANIQNYEQMENQARRTLEQFAQDTRQASVITWISPTAISLTVDGKTVIYAYSLVSEPSGRVSGDFVRITSTSRLRLLRGITTFAFSAYTITGDPIPGIGTTTSLAQAGMITKQLQISLQASRQSQTVTTATNTVLSARFILRNKKVTA